jgi:hypothetical protein
MAVKSSAWSITFASACQELLDLLTYLYPRDEYHFQNLWIESRENSNHMSLLLKSFRKKVCLIKSG